MDMVSFAKAKAQKKEKAEESSRITSRDNRWLKRFRACLGGEEGGDGIVGVEGVRLVEAALGSELAVEALLVSESGERHLARREWRPAPQLAWALRILWRRRRCAPPRDRRCGCQFCAGYHAPSFWHSCASQG